jgi:hypothetical protein
MQQPEPPRRLSTELVQLDHGLKQIERARHPGLQRASDSLPVLEAFQMFLDAERRKARARLVTLFVAALATLLLIGAGAIFLVLKTSGDLQGRVDRFALASQNLSREVAAAQEKAHSTIGAFESQLETIQKELADGLAEAIRLSETNAPIELPPAYHEAMAAMQTQLAEMRTANASLATALKDVTNQWAEALASTPEEPLVTQTGSEPLPLPEPVMPPLPQNAAVTDVNNSITLLISPPGDATPVKWRLPAIRE